MGFDGLSDSWKDAQATEFDVDGGVKNVFAKQAGIGNELSVTADAVVENGWKPPVV